MPICPSKIRAALHVDAERVSDIVQEMLEDSQHIALRRIKDGGVVNPHHNSETIIYGKARQAFKEYQEKDYSEKPLIAGDMIGADCGGKTSLFETDINDIVDNACSGECLIDFSQGYRRRGFKDYDIKPKTNVICASELAGKGPVHVKAFFDGFVDNFTKWGFDNFDANLQNFVIRYGEANASVQTADYFDVTAGYFVAPPVNRISIHFLEQYRLHMVRAGGLTNEGFLEIEMPQADWLDAVRFHQIHTMGANAQFNTTLYKDEVGPFKGREFGTWGNIKCYFNETPVKGYFKKTGRTGGGQDQYQFVRIYPWTNIAGEEAGLVSRPNHAYDKAVVWCNGVKFDLCILAFVINEKSFTRHGLDDEYKPGEPMVPSNYKVVVRDGAWLSGEQCGNDYGELFKLVARHRFRLTMPYPEFSGAIAYRASTPAGYVIPVCGSDPETATLAPAAAQVFDPQRATACQTAACKACGHDGADDNGQCIDAPADSVLQFELCGSALTTFTGVTHQVILRVKRVGVPDGIASASYTITDTPGAGLATTPEHYVDVSGTPGTLTWADGDSADKLIKLNIVDGSGNPLSPITATLALTSPSNATVHAQCGSLVLTIEDHS